MGQGITSESQLESVDPDLTDLKRDFPDYRRRLSSEPAKKALAQVEAGADKNLGELQKIKASLAGQLRDRGVVDAEGEKFVSIMSRLKSGSAFQSRDELRSFRTRVDEAKDDAESAKRRVTSSGAENALDQIVAQYDQILKQIDRAV